MRLQSRAAPGVGKPRGSFEKPSRERACRSMLRDTFRSWMRTNMDGRYYFEHYVWPNYQAFLAEPGYEHLAMNAAVAAYHMLEWAAFSRLPSGSPAASRHQDLIDEQNKLRPTVMQACPQFGLLEDVATAYKHILTRPTGTNKRPRIITELVKVRTASRDTRWSDKEAWDDSKAWQDRYVTVVADDGTAECELLFALNEVVTYWGDCIYGSDPTWIERRPEPHTGTGILQ